MKFYNIKNPKEIVGPREAVFAGLAADGGLFMPVDVPSLPSNFIEHLPNIAFQDIVFEVVRRFLAPEFPRGVLEETVDAAVRFDAPLVAFTDTISCLELFHGPTLSFKDFGAQFMAQLMTHLMNTLDRDVTILVATSGDTGSAVAHGFHRLEGVRVILLYPKDKVSQIQEKQFTTLGDNILPLEIDGSFDDCQRLVKTALSDPELMQVLNCTSANSINIARLLAQIPYYFRALGQMSVGREIDVSVPCGNFGNLTAAVMAKAMGLPIGLLIAATNINDVVPEYLRTGQWQQKAAVPTLSNAMDVGDPSNFPRIQALFDYDIGRLREALVGYSCDDDLTIDTITRVLGDHDRVLDPHGAVACHGLQSHLRSRGPGPPGLFLATAHPAKFRETIAPLAGKHLIMPTRLAEALEKEGHSVPLAADFADLKAYLLN